MKDERETRAYRRLELRRARAELRLARLDKRRRANDTHRQFRAGGIGALLGWDELPVDERKERAEAVRRLLADPSTHPDLRARGERFDAERGNTSALPAETPFVRSDEVRARRRRQLELGALLLGDASAELDPAIVAGAVLLVDERRSSTGTARP